MQVKNVNEINQIRQYVSTNFIKCVKYNNQIDPGAIINKHYEALIEISADFQELIITNRLSVEKIRYTNENDPSKLNDLLNKEYEIH